MKFFFLLLPHYSLNTMIQIILLKGKDKQLYRLLAPLVMDPDVIRANNNYPFKTNDDFLWFVAVEGKEVLGFAPVEQKAGKRAIINNYYISAVGEQREGLLSDLLSSINTNYGTEEWVLDSVTLIQDQQIFAKAGFSPLDKKWTRYVKMRR